MAITLANADNALKTVYLDAVAEELDTNLNPFFSAINKSTNDVWGKEVRTLAIHGMNGGVGAGTEDGSLPEAKGNNYTQFVTTLKNLYGVIEISDKAIRASENNAGAFVSLLNAEMQGLIKSSRYNFSRMLFGDGTGTVAKVSSIMNGFVVLEDATNLVEGMCIDFRDSNGNLISEAAGRVVLAVDMPTNIIKITGSMLNNNIIPTGTIITVQGSYNNEITGLGALFSTDTSSLYGVEKVSNPWLCPYILKEAGDINELMIQTALDSIEQTGGKSPNLIICSMGVRRALQQLFSTNKRVIDTIELQGGYKAMSYNGIPIVADRFCPKGTMYLINTNDFTLHQLCDWQWLTGDDGSVLKQIPGKPVYTATLVKYADLICSLPNGQGMISDITEA